MTGYGILMGKRIGIARFVLVPLTETKENEIAMGRIYEN